MSRYSPAVSSTVLDQMAAQVGPTRFEHQNHSNIHTPYAQSRDSDEKSTTTDKDLDAHHTTSEAPPPLPLSQDRYTESNGSSGAPVGSSDDPEKPPQEETPATQEAAATPPHGGPPKGHYDDRSRGQIAVIMLSLGLAVFLAALDVTIVSQAVVAILVSDTTANIS